ncbi:MAG: 2-dehydropantoate 2-reductase [Kiloniellales bacterium]
MKIAILGVGAMGSIYAALLAEAGHEVWAVDTWAAHLQAIAERGLRVEGASGDRNVTAIKTADHPAAVGRADLYVIATKAAAVGAVAAAIAPFCDQASLVLTIQNGLGTGERVAKHLPTDRVLLGVAEGFGASMKGPGHAHHNAMRRIRIGEMQGGMSARLERLVALWCQAGFQAQAYADIEQLIWEKFLCNVTFSAPCTVFDCTIGELMGDPERWAIALGCMREAYAVGRARNVAFAFEDPEDYVTTFGRSMPDARPSMLLDHHAKRRSEIDAINGQVAPRAEKLGMDAPYNKTLTAIVRAREDRF